MNISIDIKLLESLVCRTRHAIDRKDRQLTQALARNALP